MKKKKKTGSKAMNFTNTFEKAYISFALFKISVLQLPILLKFNWRNLLPCISPINSSSKMRKKTGQPQKCFTS